MSTMSRTSAAVSALVSALTISVAARGQEADAAFVTVLAGSGAERLTGEGATPIDGADFSVDQNQLAPGDGLRTLAPDGTAVVVLPGLDAMAYIEPASEFRLEAPLVSDGGVSLMIRIITGRATIVQKATSKHWLVIAGGSKTRGPAAYTLSKGAVVFIEASAEAVTFASRRGQALLYQGLVPAAKLIDASGAPADASGVALAQGQRLTVRAADQPGAERDSGRAVPETLAENVEAFAMRHGTQWLEAAEKGDFTPVRGAARGAPELLSGGFEPALVFDQPRPVLTTTTSRPADTAIRTALDPAQALSQSGAPGTVVAAQRFRRSRIIANPGTSRTGALVFNPSSRLPFELAGGR